jgi:hypothetical protein
VVSADFVLAGNVFLQGTFSAFTVFSNAASADEDRSIIADDPTGLPDAATFFLTLGL